MSDSRSDFESAPDAFPVHIAQFEGPLDLLLHLIKKNEVDVHDIPIAVITQQYLDAIGLMQESARQAPGPSSETCHVPVDRGHRRGPWR